MDCYAKVGDWSKLLNFSEDIGIINLIFKGYNFLDQLKSPLEKLKFRVENLLTQIGEWRENIQKYILRLEIVRRDKEKKLADWLVGEDFEEVGQSEALSEASTTLSNISKMSKMSTASARKRKQVLILSIP